MPTRKAFTLIELLVVIAIIAILAAILLPVFAKARAKGYQAQCVSNAKQLGTAMLSYASDYDETLPRPIFMAGPMFAYSPPSYGWPVVLSPYVKSTELFTCKTFERRQIYNGSPAPVGNEQGVSYGMNFQINWPFMAGDVGGKLAGVTYPTQTLLLYELSGDTGDRWPTCSLSDDGNSWPGSPNPVEGTIANVEMNVRSNHLGDTIDFAADTGFSTVLWADGHVKPSRIESLVALGNSAEGNKWKAGR